MKSTRENHLISDTIELISLFHCIQNAQSLSDDRIRKEEWIRIQNLMESREPINMGYNYNCDKFNMHEKRTEKKN